MEEAEKERIRKQRAKEASLRYRIKHAERIRQRDREAKKRERSRDRTRYNKKMKKWRDSDPRKKMSWLLTVAKGRAKKLGIEFNVSIDDLEIPTCCPLLGVEINYAVNAGFAVPNSPSIDRINPKLGYVKGNVWIVSWRANRIKNDSSLEELERLTENLKKKMSNET